MRRNALRRIGTIITNFRKVLTVIRYSTARSGLLKLALKALNTCSRGKPISTMLLMVDCNASPDKKDPILPNAGVDAGAGEATDGAEGSGDVAAGTEGGGGRAGGG